MTDFRNIWEDILGTAPRKKVRRQDTEDEDDFHVVEEVDQEEDGFLF